MHSHPLQHMPRDAKRELMLADEHLSQEVPLEQLGFVRVVRTQDDFDLRIELPGDCDHFADTERIERGYHQHPGARDVSLDQDRGVGRIARDSRYIALPKLLHQFAVLLGDHVRDPVRIERLRDATSHASVTDQHDLSGEERLIDARRQLGKRIGAALQASGKRGSRT